MLVIAMPVYLDPAARTSIGFAAVVLGVADWDCGRGALRRLYVTWTSARVPCGAGYVSPIVAARV